MAVVSTWLYFTEAKLNSTIADFWQSKIWQKAEQYFSTILTLFLFY